MRLKVGLIKSCINLQRFYSSGLKSFEFFMTKKFPRPVSIALANNKGGIGKTTLCFELAWGLAEKGYKVAMLDLDPQANLTTRCLFDKRDEGLLPLKKEETVWGLVSDLEDVGDINIDVPFISKKEGASLHRLHPQAPDSLFLLPGHLNLGNFEDSLADGFRQAAESKKRGFSLTSAFHRFIQERGQSDEIDIFIVDTSPALGFLNRSIFLTVDYFVMPVVPDVYAVDAITNLGEKLKYWKDNWKKGPLAITDLSPSDGNGIESRFIIGKNGNASFLGYILNDFRVYSGEPIKTHKEWAQDATKAIENRIHSYHNKNGLNTLSPIGRTQNYSRVASLASANKLPIGKQEIVGHQELSDKAQEEILRSIEEIERRILKYH